MTLQEALDRGLACVRKPGWSWDSRLELPPRRGGLVTPWCRVHDAAGSAQVPLWQADDGASDWEVCTVMLLEYRGLQGEAHYDGEADLWRGQVLAVPPGADFEGRTAADAEVDFRRVVAGLLRPSSPVHVAESEKSDPAAGSK